MSDICEILKNEKPNANHGILSSEVLIKYSSHVEQLGNY